jgi:hypothetical protein
MTTEFPSYERVMTAKALLLLRLAAGLGMQIGTDGVEVVTICTSRVPSKIGRWIHAELCKHKHEVIAAIMSETAARTRRAS